MILDSTQSNFKTENLRDILLITLQPLFVSLSARLASHLSSFLGLFYRKQLGFDNVLNQADST